MDGRLPKVDSALVEEFKREVLDMWCAAVREARVPLVVEARKEPENQWHIHPAIGGCRKDDVIE